SEDPEFERYLPALDKRRDRRVRSALRHCNILRTLRLRQVTRLIEAEIDVTFFVAALELPGLHPSAHHRHFISRLVDVITSRLQRLLPHPDAALGDEDRRQSPFVGFWFYGRDRLAAGVRRDCLLLAGAWLCRCQVTEMHRVDNIRFDNAD